MAQELHAPTIPTHLGTRTHHGYNVKFIVGGLLPLALVVYLVFQLVQVTRSTGAYWMTVSELYAAGPDLAGQRIRVNGQVVAGSEDWNAQEVTLKFSIHDENGDVLPVVFYGPRPDNFQRAAEAIAEGQLLPDGTFQADNLLLKCPSRYDEEPEEVFVEATR
jgi:cytochrome c-type biogenesis protein CcmE